MGDRLALYGWLLFWHVLDNLDSKQALRHEYERKHQAVRMRSRY